MMYKKILKEIENSISLFKDRFNYTDDISGLKLSLRVLDFNESGSTDDFYTITLKERDLGISEVINLAIISYSKMFLDGAVEPRIYLDINCEENEHEYLIYYHTNLKEILKQFENILECATWRGYHIKHGNEKEEARISWKIKIKNACDKMDELEVPWSMQNRVLEYFNSASDHYDELRGNYISKISRKIFIKHEQAMQ